MILRLGSRGSDVLILQSALKEKGFDPGPLDGVFGKKTEMAVIAFQVSIELVPDGLVGAMTAAALHFDKSPSSNGVDLEWIDSHFKKGTIAWYEAAYKILQYDDGFGPSIKAAAERALHLKSEYIWGEEHTGVPWIMLLGCHLLECGNNPRGVLHNGQLIVGTGRVTTIGPKGRGPFATFRESIVDAVNLQGLLNSVKPDAWTIGMMLKQSELFNGSGYLRYHPHENSPYLWARTNINDGTGKYVSDSKWSETADANAQVGVAAVYKELERMGEWTPRFST